MRKFVTTLVMVVCTGLSTARANEAPRPSITVTGYGKVLYVPDIGYIHVGISSNAWTAAEAWKKNEESVKKIFEELRKLGVEEKDLKTSNVSVQTRYQYEDKKQPKFMGYTVSYDLSVTVRKLDQMGAMLDSMMEGGANQNMNISFGCSKLDELIDDARARAVADARKKATLYVTGAGAMVGDVLGISDTPYALPVRNFPIDAVALKEGKASLPIAAGEQEIDINLTVTWAIDNRHLEPQVNIPLAKGLFQPVSPAAKLEASK
jgi:uncharacterized protein